MGLIEASTDQNINERLASFIAVLKASDSFAEAGVFFVFSLYVQV